jgi:hypothetical protein
VGCGGGVVDVSPERSEGSVSRPPHQFRRNIVGSKLARDHEITTTTSGRKPKGHKGIKKLSKHDANAKLSAEQIALLEQAAAVANQIATLPAEQPPAKPQVFILSESDGHAITACSQGNERAVCQWSLEGLRRVLEPGQEATPASLQLLEVARSILLSSQPKSPLESLLITQAICTHEMIVAFANRALKAKDSDISGKLSERFARLADVACRQAETIQRLRGEAGRQHVTVQHLNVESGAQALVGQVNHPGASGPK